MSLSKQAKTLSKSQIKTTLAYLETTRYPVRNQVIFLLSVKAGLRAKEISSLTWDMLTDSEGALSGELCLRNGATKGNSGRVIPLNRVLQEKLALLFVQRVASPFIVTSERSHRMNPVVIGNLFACWYRALGFHGCSSHSGRRTFITNAARSISRVGGSLRDVQALAGHKALSTTQRYIDSDVAAQKKVVDLV